MANGMTLTKAICIFKDIENAEYSNSEKLES